MRKITCHCEQEFSVDIPETVDLDKNPAILSDVATGTFLACVCPACNAELHLDLRTTFEWPSKGIVLTLIPELERLSLLSGAIAPRAGETFVAGYAELADRLAVLSAGLEPVAIEALKLRLLERARETNPANSPTLIFERSTESGDLVFHAHGVRDGEVAVTTVPRRIYDAILEEYGKNPDNEDFKALVNGSYISVRNVIVED